MCVPPSLPACARHHADVPPLQKLQPFFPPLDQLRSANLRAALLRCLEQLKKNGVLGRDAVLRKTMLDDCKGDRLEDLLAVFSSAVLKKVVAEQQPKNNNRYRPAAQTLALEKRGFQGERVDVDVLILAHQVSLRTKLDRKAASRAQYKDLAGLLDRKEQGISRRREQLAADAARGDAAKLSADEKSRIRRALRNNWNGNEQWQEALIYGDVNTREDGVLTAPFDRVWRRTRSTRLGELDHQSSGLVEQLDSRVRAQRARLDRWQKFREDMFGDVSERPDTKDSRQLGRQKGINLGFGAHESLQLGRMSPRKLAATEAAVVGSEYASLLEDLERELTNIDKVASTGVRRPVGGRLQPGKSFSQNDFGQKEADDPVSDLSELEDELAKTSAPLSGSQESVRPDTGREQPQRSSRPKLSQPLSSMHAFRPKPHFTEISPTEPSNAQLPPPQPAATNPRRSPTHEVAKPSPSPARSPTRTSQQSSSLPPSRDSPPRRTQSPEQLSPSPTQQQADQILASMNAASPSPVKQLKPRHTLSLTDRTRMSMVRGTSIDADDEEDIATGSPTRQGRRGNSSRSPTKSKPATPTTTAEETNVSQPADATPDKAMGGNDLVARTRKSMANFEAAQQKAQLERRRSERRAAKDQSGPIARQTYFASVDEEGEPASKRDSTLVLEELIAKEAAGADYDSIFKSRPKIKTSPPTTPARGGFEWE